MLAAARQLDCRELLFVVPFKGRREFGDYLRGRYRESFDIYNKASLGKLYCCLDLKIHTCDDVVKLCLLAPDDVREPAARYLPRLEGPPRQRRIWCQCVPFSRIAFPSRRVWGKCDFCSETEQKLRLGSLSVQYGLVRGIVGLRQLRTQVGRQNKNC